MPITILVWDLITLCGVYELMEQFVDTKIGDTKRLSLRNDTWGCNYNERVQ